MNNSLKSLFTLRPPKVDPQLAINQAKQANKDSKRDKETYQEYGSRICGLLGGIVETLDPFLTKIYTQERRQQEGNEEEQKKLKELIKQEITAIETQIKTKEQNLDNLSKKQQKIADDIKEKNDQLSHLNSDPHTVNSGLKVQMILGLIIIVLLTIYLFIFYSSTIYMGFVMPSESDEALLSKALFNPQALPNAWDDGVSEFCFVLLMPVIFLALGFLFHFFKANHGIKGMIKAGLLLIVTFLFDCLLAYKIGETLYNTWVLSQLGTQNKYSISSAINDPNTWAVILCGFIAYLIWGLVFDQVVTAYEEKTTHKSEIKSLTKQINDYQKELKILDNQEADLKSDIINLEGQKKQKEQMLNANVVFSEIEIKEDLNDFFAGWLVVMKTVNPNDIQKATGIFSGTMSQLFK